MYTKPELQKFGSMRDLTLLGIGEDCDGGILGIIDGDWVGCERS